jgi:hypothetical protein
MQQIPIEEVLAEFREKYKEPSVSENSEKHEKHENTGKEIIISPDAFSRKKRGGGSITFLQIVAVQGIIAAVLFVAILALRLFSPHWHEVLSGIFV